MAVQHLDPAAWRHSDFHDAPRAPLRPQRWQRRPRPQRHLALGPYPTKALIYVLIYWAVLLTLLAIR